jgi:hypothetical protein
MRSASNVLAALDIDAFIAPAILASRTSRDSRLASCIISAVVTALPSKIPPLIINSGFSLAKSRNALAASIGSPLINATADGPASIAGSRSTPASFAAILVKVFLTTEYLFLTPSERRSCFNNVAERPRYSVSTVAFAVRKSSTISATAAVLSALAIWHPF